MRWVLVGACAVAVLWAALVMVTGGAETHVGHWRFSSRRFEPPLLVSMLSGIGVWLLSTVEQRVRIATASLRLLAPLLGVARRLSPRSAAAVAAAAALSVVAAGWLWDAPFANGADAYGYVSQAHLWAQGNLHVDQSFVRDMRWPSAADALSPLGYRVAPNGTSIVPMFPPGYPMQMAVFERLGGRNAVFWVVPLLGGLAVWATYLLGRRLSGAATGALAAVLMATSPILLFQLMLPMSDVPVTAWWAVCLALLLAGGRAATLASGLAAGAAILVRPNLLPLALVPAVFLMWRAVGARARMGPEAQRFLLFGLGVIPAGAALAIMNWRLYGSPFLSGVSPVASLYGWRNAGPNLMTYPVWLLKTETPVVLLALAAPLVLRGQISGRLGTSIRSVTVMWLWFAAVVVLSYLFYVPHDTWIWLRYLLPAFPVMLALTSAVIVALLDRLDVAREFRILAVAFVAFWLGWQGVKQNVGVFNMRTGEHRAVAVADYVAHELPDRGIFFSVQYSGSLRHYAGRLTVRADCLQTDELDVAIAELRRLGYHPYIVLDEGEEAFFRARFAGHSDVARLDWPPQAIFFAGPMIVRLYDPADRGNVTPRAPVVVR